MAVIITICNDDNVMNIMITVCNALNGILSADFYFFYFFINIHHVHSHSDILFTYFRH